MSNQQHYCKWRQTEVRSFTQSLTNLSYVALVPVRPATIHRCTGTSRYFFGHYMIIVNWMRCRDISNRFTYASTNMQKHCLQLVLTLLPLSSPYAQRFSEQTDKKNVCRAVFSIIFKMADTTHACFLLGLSAVQTSEPMNKTRGNTFLFCCYVTYRIVHLIVTTVSGYISYCGKMYCCRPSRVGWGKVEFLHWDDT